MTPDTASQDTERLCRLAPVIPVLVVEDVAHAAPLAKALIAGGLPVLEVTLRTPAALEVIQEMSQVEGGYVGAGTLLSKADVSAARQAGATFGVSPGATDSLLTPVKKKTCPYCPERPLRAKSCAFMNGGTVCKSFSQRRPMGVLQPLKPLAPPCHR